MLSLDYDLVAKSDRARFELPPSPLASSQADIPTRATEQWLSTLPVCSMSQFRTKLEAGGTPVFLLDERSQPTCPAWRLLVQDCTGQLWRVRTLNEPLARRLKSIRQVYQIARNAGLSSFCVPVDH